MPLVELIRCFRRNPTSRRISARWEVIKMAKKVTVHTGQNVPVSGIYKPSGGRDEFTFVRGKTVPPNPVGVRQQFTLVEKTPHERKKH